MPYLIDGHSLLQHLEHYVVDPARDRELLIQRLARFAADRRDHITIVFPHRSPSEGIPTEAQPVDVMYGDTLAKADHILRESIEATTQPTRLIVVSDDPEITSVARFRHAAVTPCSVFSAQLRALAPRPSESSPPPESASTPEPDPGSKPNFNRWLGRLMPDELSEYRMTSTKWWQDFLREH